MQSMICAMYLRKSRADLEAEARGEGETLARHRETLTAVAQRRGLIVSDVYAEVASGDTIAERPEIQKMLRAVESGAYDAVLCMDIDRLGRGDGADQAAILKTLKYSDTIVITPYKTYDPRVEMDEEFFEYSQFMARGEYKRIKRRMWAGRVAAAREGKWLSPKAPFGYRRVRLEAGRGWTLTPEPVEAEAVRSLFAWYGAGECGKNVLANRLNDMGFRTQSGALFTPSSVYGILTNPVYIGKVRWNFRRKHVEMQNGREVTTRPKSEECFLADGLHPAIVSQEAWNAVAERMAAHDDPHTKYGATMRNPLSGLMTCGVCGKTMILSPEYGRRGVESYYKCPTPGCPTSRIDSKCVYDALLYALRDWSVYDKRAIPPELAKAREAQDGSYAALSAAQAQLVQLKAQMSRLQDLLETGVYTPETYIERSKLLTERIGAASEQIARLMAATQEDDVSAIIRLKPEITALLDVWDTATPEHKNQLLRRITRGIIYHKTQRCFRGQNPADFLSLTVFPKLQ